MADVTTPTIDTELLQSWGAAVAGRLSTGCALYATGTTQSVANGISSPLTTVTFSSGQVTSDPGSWFDDANDAVVIPETGTYLLWGYARFTSNTTGGRRYQLLVAGTSIVDQLWDASVASQPLGGPLMAIYTCTAAQKITVMAGQSSGGALDIITKGLAAYRLW